MAEQPPLGLNIRLFGPLEVSVQGQPIKPLRTRKVGYLLALLVLHSEEEVSREWLAGRLWPDSVDTQALYNLRQALTNLRSALTTEATRLLAPTPRTLRLDLQGASTDLLAFDAAIAQGDETGLRQAVALYRGPLLETCLEEWALTEQRRREQNYLEALEALANYALQHQEAAQAVAYLRQATGLDPFCESVHRRLMEALVAEGNQADAIQVYRDLRIRLRRELNIAPDPQTQALFQRLRARNLSLPSPTSPSVQSPPLSFRPVVGLPQALTPLVGREEEVEQTLDALASVRLLTLIGIGGVGKSRLAMVVAQERAETVAGEVWFVELARLTEGVLVARAVASVLGIHEQAKVPLLQTLIEAFSLREGLLILDNCEHLLRDCQALASELLRFCPRLRILTTSRQPLGVKGETLLAVPSLPFPSPGDDQNPLDFAAVQLLAQRVAPVPSPSRFTPQDRVAMARICRALDGIPLAIELAAGRAKVLSLPQIAERMESRLALLTRGEEEALPQHRTLRATLDWSYQLLSQPEQLLLRLLSVFAGGCTLEAVENILEGVPEVEVLDLLTGLLEKGLLERREGQEGGWRFRVLETIREYGHELLETHDELQPLRERHARYYLELAERLAPQIHGPRQKVVLDMLEAEHDNFRAALRWALPPEADSVTSTQSEVGLRLTGVLFWFWQVRGYLLEGRAWLERSLERTDPQERSRAHATALHGAAQLAFYDNDAAVARSLFERSAAIWQELGDPWGRAYCAIYYAISLAFYFQEVEVALSLLEESLSLWRQIGDQWGLAMALWAKGYQEMYFLKEAEQAHASFGESIRLFRQNGTPLGLIGPLWYESWIMRDWGENAIALRYAEEVRSILRALGDRMRLTWCLEKMIEWAYADGRLDDAQAYVRELLETQIARRNRGWITHTLPKCADVAQRQQRLVRAVTLFAAFENLFPERGTPEGAATSAEVAQHLAELQALLSEEDYKMAVAQGWAMTLEQAIAYALER